MKLEIDKDALAELDTRTSDRVIAAFRELVWKAQNTPLDFYHSPQAPRHYKQETFHSFRTPVRCFFGGNQSGKTTAGLADDLIQALDETDVPEHLKRYKFHHPATDGPFLCRIFAPSVLVLETATYQKLLEMLPLHALSGGSWRTAYDRDTRVLSFANGSKFFFNTYEQEVAKLGAVTLHRVHYDEEPPREIRLQGRNRVMKEGGDEIFTLTPVEGLTWMFDEFWENRGPETEKDVYVVPGEVGIVTVSMFDNPALDAAEIERSMKGLSREEREALVEGKFVALHGLVYGEFSKERHVVPEHSPPASANVVVGIDPGIRNKAAVVWVYVTADDRMVVFEEGYYDGYTVAQAALNELDASMP